MNPNLRLHDVDTILGYISWVAKFPRSRQPVKLLSECAFQKEYAEFMSRTLLPSKQPQSFSVTIEDLTYRWQNGRLHIFSGETIYVLAGGWA